MITPVQCPNYLYPLYVVLGISWTFRNFMEVCFQGTTGCGNVLYIMLPGFIFFTISTGFDMVLTSTIG